MFTNQLLLIQKGINGEFVTFKVILLLLKQQVNIVYYHFKKVQIYIFLSENMNNSLQTMITLILYV